MRTCLEGVRVLELARYQAGPRAGMVLADLGAEVIKFEKAGGEETRNLPNLQMVRGQSVYFTAYNRGKKSMVVDLRSDEGIAIFKDLVARSDIVLENFRPGTIDRMGLGYDELRAIKPDVILVSVSGFGQYGPYRDRVAFDPVGQAMSGLMDLTGKPVGMPIQTAFSLVDRTTALHAAIGALAALHRRDHTGEGEWVDVCLMDSAYTMVEIPLIHYLETGQAPQEDTGLRSLASARGAYRAKDGWVTVVAMAGNRAEVLAATLGESIDPATQPDGGADMTDQLGVWCAQRTVEEILAHLLPLGIVVAPVHTVAQAADDPHLAAREMFVKIPDPVAGEIYAPGLSVKLSNAPGTVEPVPLAGQHTRELLGASSRYSEDTINGLVERGIIAEPDVDAGAP